MGQGHGLALVEICIPPLPHTREEGEQAKGALPGNNSSMAQSGQLPEGRGEDQQLTPGASSLATLRGQPAALRVGRPQPPLLSAGQGRAACLPELTAAEGKCME